MTPDQAQEIVNAHDVHELEFNDWDNEEAGLLREYNPRLLGAYRALLALAAEADD